jgi:glutamine amidotransferase
MLTIIDYGMGNLGSIVNTLKRMDVPLQISSNPSDIQNAEKLILPGVGSFDKGIENLHRLKLIPTLDEVVLDKKTPILGICLGVPVFPPKRRGQCRRSGMG